jgi:hypothetical protein
MQKDLSYLINLVMTNGSCEIILTPSIANVRFFGVRGKTKKTLF